MALDERYRFPLLGLHEDEVRALFLSPNTRLLADLDLEAASEQMMLKFFAALPVLHQHVIEHLQQRLLVDSTRWVDDETPNCLSNLLNAVNNDYRLRVVYRHDGVV